MITGASQHAPRLRDRHLLHALEDAVRNIGTTVGKPIASPFSGVFDEFVSGKIERCKLLYDLISLSPKDYRGIAISPVKSPESNHLVLATRSKCAAIWREGHGLLKVPALYGQQVHFAACRLP